MTSFNDLNSQVKITLEKNKDSQSFIARSNTKSYNIEHVVDKDLVSFYSQFSQFAMVDTGIMPVSGTGVLAIRSAGNHTQVTFQHEPQISYINWGDHEGDQNAETYLVAQPYRIWIGDIVNGDMYGARMFYSPYPITSASQVLYHLNLPNTNCQGYRGNGVGWQCLYHTDSWVGLPFNEKIIRFAERCSGVETFNDRNMSETDGPRFYRKEYDDDDSFSYLWYPNLWQQKTSKEGLSWVLNEDLWIPIRVRGIDDQDRHDSSGEPLTLAMAMLGNYRAYYTDTLVPKPINALTRSDLMDSLTPDMIASWFVRSHNTSKTAYVPFNSLQSSQEHREKIVSTIHQFSIDNDEENIELEEEEQEEEIISTFICPITGNSCSTPQHDVYVDSLDNTYCSPCYEENTIYCENSDSTLPHNSPYIYYDDSSGEYYDTRNIDHAKCENCGSFHWVHQDDPSVKISDLIFYGVNDSDMLCVDCMPKYLKSNYPNHTAACFNCGASLPVDPSTNIPLQEWSHTVKTVNNVFIDGADELVKTTMHMCKKCSNLAVQCPTGHTVFLPLVELPVPIVHKVSCSGTDTIVEDATVHITHMCPTCANPEIWQGGIAISKENASKLSSLFCTINRAEDRFDYSFSAGITKDSKYFSVLTPDLSETE